MKMSSKVSATLCMAIFFFLFLTFTYAGRTSPTSSPLTSSETQPAVFEVKFDVEENCKGIAEDECLMRRTLEAHTDYIYTQKQNP